ncbi:hypothetical protein ACA910_009626 [Epithemia clementina (nom. ined.)]
MSQLKEADAAAPVETIHEGKAKATARSLTNEVAISNTKPPPTAQQQQSTQEGDKEVAIEGASAVKKQKGTTAARGKAAKKSFMAASGDHQTPSRAIGAATGTLKTKKRSASFLETSNEAKSADTTPSEHRGTPASAVADTPSINNMQKNASASSTATTTTTNKKRRAYHRRTKRSGSSHNDSKSTATTTVSEQGDQPDGTTDDNNDEGPYYPPGWNAFDSVLQESADLSQAAAEAQQLGRLKMASTYLLLLHARLVGLGKRFDKLRAPILDDQEMAAAAAAGGLESMEEDFLDHPNNNNDATNEPNETTTSTSDLGAPYSPPSLRHYRSMTPKQGSVDHQPKLNTASIDVPLSSPSILMSPPHRNSWIRNHDNKIQSTTTSQTATTATSNNDGSLNVQAISASVTHTLEQQQEQQQHASDSSSRKNNNEVLVHDLTSPSPMTSSHHKQNHHPNAHRNLPTATTATTTGTPKTAAAKQLVRMLPSHIEMDQAMMEHLAKAAAQLHAARSGQDSNEKNHADSTLASASTRTSEAKATAQDDAATVTITEMASTTATSFLTTHTQPNRGVSFTDQESQMLKAAAQAGNPNSRALAKQTGRSEVQIKAFLRNLDTKKRLLQDLELGLKEGEEADRVHSHTSTLSENDKNDGEDHDNDGNDEAHGGGESEGGTTGKKSGAGKSGGGGGRGRKPSTTAMNTVPNAVCDARVLLQGNLLLSPRVVGHTADDDDNGSNSVENADDAAVATNAHDSSGNNSSPAHYPESLEEQPEKEQLWK